MAGRVKTRMTKILPRRPTGRAIRFPTIWMVLPISARDDEGGGLDMMRKRTFRTGNLYQSALQQKDRLHGVSCTDISVSVLLPSI